MVTLGFELGRLSAWSHAELELGARVPLVRYTLATSTGSELFRTPALGGELALGLRWAP